MDKKGQVLREAQEQGRIIPGVQIDATPPGAICNLCKELIKERWALFYRADPSLWAHTECARDRGK